MERKNELVERLIGETQEVKCSGRNWEPHRCVLVNCPDDDPDFIHICYFGDFDWTEGDDRKVRLGQMQLQEFNEIGQTRATDRWNRMQRAGQLVQIGEPWTIEHEYDGGISRLRFKMLGDSSGNKFVLPIDRVL